MKKFSFVYLLTALISAYFILSSHSGGEATVGGEGKTKAPGETYCSDCHGGGVFGPVSVSIQIFSHGTSNAITAYQPDTLYDMKVTVTAGAGSPAGYGFQMTCLTSGANSPLAGYSNLESSVTTKLLTATGRTYIEQKATSTPNFFTFSWTAPAAGTGTVVFYAAGNAVNGDRNTSGDNANYTSLSLPQVSAPLTLSAVTTNVLCFGANTGAINLTASGGTGPYTYNWGGGITSQNRTSLTAGNYTVTVTDHASATATASYTISQPASALNVSGTGHNVSCFGGNSGSINISASGGTAGYTYNWGGGVTSQNRSALTAGNYAVTVTDANSCIASASFSITQPANALSVSGSTGNVSCFGGNNGSINITASGGTAGYTYNWGGGVTSQNRTTLTAGNYAVTVTDANSCVASASFSITQPANALSVSGSTGNVSCFGGNNGSINITASGGTAGYTYNWGSGITSQNRASITAGNYAVTVTDANSCMASASFAVTQPANALSVSGSTGNVSCFGGNNGSINITASGGTAGYTYNWGGGVSSQNRASILAGNYAVTVTDANTCIASASFSVTQPANALSVSGSTGNVSCFGGNNGSINITASGGTAGYTYNWGNGITSKNRGSLTAGNYAVTVTDANSCIASASFSVTQPANALSISGTVQNVSCFGGNNGSINITASGGTAGYTYNWGNNISTQNRNALVGGNYFVTVTDTNHCTASDSFNVSQPAVLGLTDTASRISCYGGNSTVIIGATGGTAPYTGTGDFVVQSGLHNYVIIDANGCTDSASLNISQPTQLIASATNVTIPCAGGNGTITVSATGGTGPYTGTGSFTVNTPGAYNYSVSDAQGCTATATGTAIALSGLSDTANITGISCNGLCDGNIFVSVSGGTPPYSYTWNDSTNSRSATNLCAGNYVQTITDSAGCSIVNNYVVPGVPALQINITKDSIYCYGDSANILADASGGTWPYNYQWNTGQAQSNIKAPAGAYSLSITDNHNCADSTTFSIAQPAQLAVSGNENNVLCFGNSTGAVNITVTGGASPYSYNWGYGITTKDLDSVPAGNYSVNITDNNACTATGAFTVMQPEQALNVTGTTVKVLCFGRNTGAINLNASGGTLPYIFNWGNGITTKNRNSLPAGNYSVAVSDSNACADTAVFAITQTAALNVSGITQNVLCFAESKGAIYISPAGGTSPYTFNWGYGITSQNRVSIPAGNYSVIVADSNACTDTTSFIITQPSSALNITGTTIKVMCFGENTGAINLNTTGGTSPYQFNWGGGITGENRDSLSAGDYFVVVSDSNACSDTASFTVTQADSIDITLLSVLNDTGNNTGAINILVSGGTGPYAFTWSNSDTTQDLSHLGQGTYALTVTDSAGCFKSIENISIIATGIEDLQAESIKIYPNPLSVGSWQLAVGNDLIGAQLEILDADGRVVYKSEIRNLHSEIDAQIAGGVYLLRVTNGAAVVVRKLVKL